MEARGQLRSTYQVLITRCESRGDLRVNIDEEDNCQKKKLKILIAGGGIGGLVYALAAKRSGLFDVSVFEKDLTAARGEGRNRGPIQLSSSCLNLLQRIDKDVTREIIETGHVTTDRENGLADGKSGQWLTEFDFITPAVRKGLPISQMICRVDLQRILLNAVGEDNIMNKSKVVNFVSDANKVTVFLENGEQYEGDVLIGSDGIRSMVCAQNYGTNKEPKYSNFACYTGITECSSEFLPRFGYKGFLGMNKFLLAADIGNGRMQWYAFVREALIKSPVSSKGYKNMLFESYGEWCDEVVTILSRTEEEDIIRRPIYDIGMMSTWGKGRVVLLGDAAHAMLPSLGQGGSMAIEDCYWLMVELQNLAQRHTMSSEISSDEITMAFRRFEKKRMFRVRALHSMCRMIAVILSSYQNYLEIGPLQLFNVSAMRIKHPASLIVIKMVQLSLPKFIDWVIANTEA